MYSTFGSLDANACSRRPGPASLLRAVAVVVFLCSGAFAQQSLSIVGGDSLPGGSTTDLEVRMTNTAEVEGFVLAVGHDPALLSVRALSTDGSAAIAAGAELVIAEILSSGFSVGCVMDSDPPFDAQKIPVGAGQLLVTFTARVDLVLEDGDDEVVTGFSFVDGALNNPPLSNIIVQGGNSIGVGQGLVLNSAPTAITIVVPPPIALEIVPTTFDGASDCVPVRMQNFFAPVEGYVLAIAHDPAVLQVDDVNIDGTPAQILGAELVIPTLRPEGATLGVVLEFQPPFEGSAIPPGGDILLGNFCYTCLNTPVAVGDDPLPPPVVTDLVFVDGVLGEPPLDNIVVVGGLSIPPILTGGTVTVPPVVIPVGDTAFYCGPRELPGNLDPITGLPPDVEGIVGETVELCFFYSDPTDQLLGLQIALCHDCQLSFSDFRIEDTIFDDVGAEFVSWGIDADPEDGDGCEYTVGILLDALPPFENQSVPPTMVPLLIGCVDVTISPAATCGTDLDVDFCNGINGDGEAIIENIAVIEFASIQNFTLVDGVVAVVPEEVFRRGDCNSDTIVDLADAARVIGWQFYGSEIICPDACDANDDGFINLADAVLLINYLFLFGVEPPAPGPIFQGTDPTSDLLGPCENGAGSCF